MIKGKETILSQSLWSDVIRHFNKNKTQEYIVNPSIPILFFGDLESYQKEKTKIITVGLNPSNTEFRLNKEDNYSYVRFPDYDGSIYSLEKSLNNYFKNVPYKRWFNSLEPLLNGIGYSFFPNKFNKVIHTDICSPLATEPTWSKLDNEITIYLQESGIDIWLKLIDELKPDIIIISTRYSIVRKLNPTNKSIIYIVDKTKDGKERRPFYLELYDVQFQNFKSKLVYGQPKNTPFGSVSNWDKNRMGEKIKELII